LRCAALASSIACSHASITSAEALAALWELPQTNPGLLASFEQARSKPTASEESEPNFQDEQVCKDGDDVDIPVAVVASLVMSEGAAVAEGYKVDDEGCLTWTGETNMIEDDEEDGKIGVGTAPAAMGRGHCTKMESRCYKGWFDSDKL
jgi:hypothetical protein